MIDYILRKIYNYKNEDNFFFKNAIVKIYSINCVTQHQTHHQSYTNFLLY